MERGTMPRIKKLPEEERPREKLLGQGVKKLSNTELLALLIGSGTKGASATELAGGVLARTESGLSGLREFSPEELKAITGIGDAIACRLIAAAELGSRMATSGTLKRVKVETADIAVKLCEQEFAGEKQECFVVLILNTKGLMMGVEKVSKGGINTSMAEPRDVFRGAIKRGAAAIIALHNHPSGDPEPSAADEQVTKRLSAAGEVLGIRLLDHIIVGAGRHVSLKDRGMVG